MAARLFALALLMFGAIAAAPGAERAPASYELQLSAPDGRPVANRRALVRVAAVLSDFLPEVETKSDAEGRVRFEWPHDPNVLLVNVPGFGFATAPIVAPSADGVVRPPMPRLVRYSTIECIVPDHFRDEVVDVELTPVNGPLQFKAPKPKRPDREGRVVFRDRPPGEQGVGLRNAAHTGVAGGVVACRPGVKTTFRPLERAPNFSSASSSIWNRLSENVFRGHRSSLRRVKCMATRRCPTPADCCRRRSRTVGESTLARQRPLPTWKPMSWSDRLRSWPDSSRPASARFARSSDDRRM